MELDIKTAQKRTELSENEIRGVLYIITCEKKIALKRLIAETGIPKASIITLLKSLRPVVGFDGRHVYTEEGKNGLVKTFAKKYSFSLLEYTNKELEEKISRLRKKYGIKPKRKYDQFFATEKTTVSKAEIMRKKGCLEGKRIALIGDDDLVSIAINLISKPESVVVFEVDKDIAGLIKKAGRDMGAERIRVVEKDIRNLGSSAKGVGFDCVVTDPPYTHSGTVAFLKFAVELLTPGKGKYIFLYYGNSFKSPDNFIGVQKIINSFHLVIEDKIDKFARYRGAESIGNASSLYILKTTSRTSPQSYFLSADHIYTFQKKSPGSFPYMEHHTLKLFGVKKEFTTKVGKASEKTRLVCKKLGLKIVSEARTKFDSKGFTLVLVLSNSNLSLHSWPEYGAIHIDILTCSNIQRKALIPKLFINAFEADSVEYKRLE